MALKKSSNKITHRSVQFFSNENLENSRRLSPEQALILHEQMKQLAFGAQSSKSHLISIKVPMDLLSLFKIKAEKQGLRYQTQIKNLMRKWVLESE